MIFWLVFFLVIGALPLTLLYFPSIKPKAVLTIGGGSTLGIWGYQYLISGHSFHRAFIVPEAIIIFSIVIIYLWISCRYISKQRLDIPSNKLKIAFISEGGSLLAYAFAILIIKIVYL